MIPDRCLALPPGVLDRTDLSTVAKLVAAALNDRFARFDPSTWVGNQKLAQAIGRSIGHARRGLAELIRRGLVGREETSETPTGRRLWLLWRHQARDLFNGAQTPCPSARTYVLEALTVGQLRDVTTSPITRPPDNSPDTGPPANARAASARTESVHAVATIPAMIQALRHGAPADVRADLVNRMAHRLRDRQPATYGFLRKWVNAAADGVGGALEALAHGYAKAEAALLGNHPCPGRVLVRRVRDFVYRPPAPSTIGVVEPHRAATAVAVVAEGPKLDEAELVAELDRARALSRRFGGGFKQTEADLQAQLEALRARAAP